MGFLSLLAIAITFLFFSSSGMPVNQPVVGKRIDHYKQQHLSICLFSPKSLKPNFLKAFDVTFN